MTNKEKQKEKLTDLIIESVDGCARHLAEIISDYLLDSGNVIVTPCKVGDTVYVNIQYLLPDGSYRTEGPVVGQVCSICFYKDGNEIEIEGDDPYFEKASIYRSSADFGNNVFLTTKEAERALKEREGHG